MVSLMVPLSVSRNAYNPRARRRAIDMFLHITKSAVGHASSGSAFFAQPLSTQYLTLSGYARIENGLGTELQ